MKKPTAEEIEAYRAKLEAEYEVSGGFDNWVRQREAARLASEARGYPVNPEGFRVKEYETEAERLDVYINDPHVAMAPTLWAFCFASELALLNGWDTFDPQRAAAEIQVMRSFESHTETLPLRQYPTGIKWPKGEPLPPKWADGMFMQKDELREWAKEHCPDLLESRLINPQRLEDTEESQEIERLRSEAQMDSAYQEADINGSSINWKYWIEQLPKLTCAQAARLMCGLDPDIYASLEQSRDDTEIYKLCLNAMKIQRMADSEEIEGATPFEWLQWAERHNFAVFDGFRNAVKSHASYVDIAEEVAGMTELVWNGEDKINWKFWFETMPNLNSGDAARLLNGLDPEIHRDLDKSPNTNDTGEQRKKARRIERVAHAERKDTDTPIGWFKWAEAKNLNVALSYRVNIANFFLRMTTAHPPGTVEQVKPIPAQRFQEQEILRVIRKLGYDPLKLPKALPGKPGVKAEVRRKLSFSVKVFNLAWERLRASEQIQDA